MRTVSFEYLLTQVQSLRTGRAELPSTNEYAALRGWLDLSLGECGESEEWPDLRRLEPRVFRPIWAQAATYAAGDEVYYPLNEKYYQSVVAANSGNEPSVNGDNLDNSEFWVELKTSYSGKPWSETSYTLGAVGFQSDDDEYYVAIKDGVSPLPDAEPPDPDFWHRLQRFARYVALDQPAKTPIGEVFAVTTADPRVTRNWQPVPWELTENGVEILEVRSKVWLRFRIPRPDLTGENYDAEAAYEVGDQIYFTPTIGQGNLYTCVSAAAAGESPLTNAAKWSVVEIPKIFAGYLTWAAFAKSLTGDGQHGKQRQASVAADGYLQLEVDKLLRQQQQAQSMAPTTY